MKIKTIIFFIVISCASRLFCVTGEYTFRAINLPMDCMTSSALKHEKFSTVFDCNHEPTNLYNGAIVSTP